MPTDDSSRDPSTEMRAEQAYLDHAYDCLDTMASRAADVAALAQRAVEAENTPDAHIARFHLERRSQALNADPGPLCFGRIDTEEGDRWYVGRRHVEDGDSQPVVVDWRAPVSAAFYRATAADPYGLTHRRRFSLEGRTISAIFDEQLDDPEAAATAASGIPDPLLAELDRSRLGQMSDIVSTIAAEQDEIIRAPLDELLVVQGGPGTGKTAVGLHRAAFLLFQHRAELATGGPGAVADAGVLVLGPNPLFLRYIADVLPSLGEVAVRQATIATLVAAKYRVRGQDEPEVEEIKGRTVMADVVAAAVRSAIRVPGEGLELRSGVAVVRFSPDEVEGLIKTILAGGLPQNQGRDVFRRRIVAEAWQRHSARSTVDPGTEPIFTSQMGNDAANRSALDRCWSTVAPPTIIRRLFSSPRFLSSAAAGLLTVDERARLKRPAPKRGEPDAWTVADITLLDEAEAACNGQAVTYGHIVVDEAQDLSPMALRMVGRRSARGSMTILGDLAQATSPAAGSDGGWDRAVDVLVGVRSGRAGRDAPTVHFTELTVGYRVPASIIELANRLLVEAAPSVTPVRAVRPGGDPPLIVNVVDPDQVAATVAREAIALVDRGFSLAVIALDPAHHDLVSALEAAGMTVSVAGRSAAGLAGNEAVTVLNPAQAKGLEFDAVVVVEGGDIADEPAGLRHLYVAMTRAVQHLGLVQHRSLPRLLQPDTPATLAP